MGLIVIKKLGESLHFLEWEEGDIVKCIRTHGAGFQLITEDPMDKAYRGFHYMEGELYTVEREKVRRVSDTIRKHDYHPYTMFAANNFTNHPEFFKFIRRP